MTEILFEKRCQCKGTASGPRAYPVSQHRAPVRKDRTRVGIVDRNGWYITYGYASMVCDVCETPWVETALEPEDATGVPHGEGVLGD